jgi:hypothetical protein
LSVYTGEYESVYGGGFPLTPLDVTVELQLAGQWTGNGVNGGSGGGGYAGVAASGCVTVSLDNCNILTGTVDVLDQNFKVRAVTTAPSTGTTMATISGSGDYRFWAYVT